jgi:hypothetical protein
LAKNASIVPPETPAPEQSALAEQVPIEIAQDLDEPEAPFLLRCVDTNGGPVESAEVYFVHDKLNLSGTRMPTSTDEHAATGYGPYVTDADGFASLPYFEEPDESIPYRVTDHYSAYARVPGKLVGAWRYTSWRRSEPDWNHIVLVESMQIRGTVVLPAGFEPRDVSVTVLILDIQDGRRPHAASFSASSKLHPPQWPEIFVATPDEGGRFVLNDIPKSGRFYLRPRGLDWLRSNLSVLIRNRDRILK